MMNKETLIKIASVVLPVAGIALNFATNWLDDKKLDEKIAEKIAEANSQK